MLKKHIFSLISVIFIAIFTCFSPANAESVQESIENEINEQLNDLDLNEFSRFGDEILSEVFDSDTKSMIKRIVDGEFDGWNDFFNVLINDFKDSLLKFVPDVTLITVICLIFSIVMGFQDGIMNNSLKNVLNFVCFASIITVLLKNVYEIVSVAKTSMIGMSNLINLTYPILTVLLAVCGGKTTIATFSPFVALLGGVITNLIVNVIFPIFIVCTIFSIVGNLTDSVKLNGLRSFASSVSNWTLGSIFGVYSTLSIGGGIIGGGIDSVSVKAAKFAISGYVPIIGGYLSDGLDVIAAGSVLIKNAIGLVSVLILLLIVVVPVVKCAVFSLSLKLCAGILESFADKKTVNMLNSIVSSVKIVISALLAVGTMFLITVILIIGSSNYLL